MISENEKFFVVDGMTKSGGSFVKTLGELIQHSDHINRAKIKTTWPEYWAEYLDIGKKLNPQILEEMKNGN